MLLNQKGPLLPRNLALGTLGKLLIVFSTKVKSAIPPLFNGPRVWSSASDKAKLFTENFSRNLFGPDCIPVVVLKNCEPELSYILAELFNMCLKESYFPECWKVSSVTLNVGEGSNC